MEKIPIPLIPPQKQKELVSTGIRSNKWSPIWAGLAAVMAIVAAFVAYLDYDKPIEKLSPTLLRIDSTLQMHMQIERDSLQKLKNEKAELHRILDSLTKKP